MDEPPQPPNCLEHVAENEISVRLPVKSMYRFRGISKKWNSLPCDEDFIKQHASTMERPRVLLISKEFWSLVLDGLERGILEFTPVPNEPMEHRRIVGSSEGFILLVDSQEHSLRVINPSSTAFKNIPPSPFIKTEDENHSGWFCSSNLFGFGRCSLGGVHKIVQINCSHINSSLPHYSGGIMASVFDFKTGGWRSVPQQLHLMFDQGPPKGTFLNGVIYWLVYNMNLSCMSLLSFDINAECFDLFVVPDSVKIRSLNFSLDVLEGKISIVPIRVEPRKTSYIWKKSDGVAWEEIQLDLDVDIPAKLLCIWQGNILLGVKGKLCIYSLHDHLFHEHEIHDRTRYMPFIDAAVYEETLQLF